MYQLTYSLDDNCDMGDWLGSLHERIARSGNPHAAMLFRILNATPDTQLNASAIDAIGKWFPEAPYIGCSSNTNVIDGELSNGNSAFMVVCDVFEDPDTKVCVVQKPLDYDCQDETAQALVDYLAAHPEVKAVEMLNTVLTANMPRFCEIASQADERVAMFGGGALNWQVDFSDVVVFSSDGEPTGHGIVFALYSGERLHVQTSLVQGWKPLGMSFRITQVDRGTLYELNDQPALDVYNHYLQFSERDDFLESGLCFPLCIESNGMQIMRTPIDKGADGSILIPTDMSGVKGECRIAYGDPIAARKSLEERIAEMKAFGPQALLVFACVGRLMYWGPEFAALETRPLKTVAPIAGFYTGGELVRLGRSFMSHNLALVLAGMREGEPDAHSETEEASALEPMALNLQLSIIGHMASFIGVAADELQKAYERMDAIARTDGLTGLANRREVEREVIGAVKGYQSRERGKGALRDTAPSLVMLDLDNFKRVNDTCGHAAGDEVLRRMADLLHSEVESAQRNGRHVVAGRWGGEEFMVLLASTTLGDAESFAEHLRESFARIEFEGHAPCTTSVGVAQLRADDTSDSLCSRVDHAMYRAKELGKNRVFVDRA